MPKPKYRYPAKKVELWAVYRQTQVFGSPVRWIEAAFPERVAAEKWLEDIKNRELYVGNYTIEPIKATMGAWNP